MKSIVIAINNAHKQTDESAHVSVLHIVYRNTYYNMENTEWGLIQILYKVYYIIITTYIRVQDIFKLAI
jgi:hypothetical protein